MGPYMVCCASLITRRTVTLNFSVNDTDISMSSLRHLYEVNPSTILHCTPVNEQSTEILNNVGECHNYSVESKPGTEEHRLPVGFHVHERQKQAKLITGVRSQVHGCPGMGHEGVLGADYLGVSENSPSGTLMIFVLLWMYIILQKHFLKKKVILSGNIEDKPKSANCQSPSSLYPDVT